jgi:amino acid adenylation domain-containing protein
MTRIPYPQERTDKLVSRVAADQPDVDAVFCGARRLTYRELDERSNGVAYALLERGVIPGDLVGIYMERSELMPVAMLGVFKSGAAYVPMDPAYPAQRIRWMVEDATMKVVLTDASHENAVREFGVDPIRVDGLAAAETCLPSVAGLDSLAYTIFTSGSTGRPKGVQIPHRALTNFLVSMQQLPGMDANDALLAVTTLSFDIAGLEMFLPLMAGGRLVIASKETAMDGKALLKTIEEKSITIMQATPVTWKLMLAAGWESSPQLKVLCGGEAFPRDLANALVSKVGSVWNMYGPTETTIWSTCDHVSIGEGSVSIGLPIANTTVYVVDENMKPVPDGQEGELVIGGDGLAIGYLGNPELTAEKFTRLAGTDERVYRTGDLAKFLPGGRLECLGRIDHQIKLRGFRIELGEIETALRAHEAVADAAVALYEKDGNPRLIAYLILSGGQGIDLSSSIYAWLVERLPAYMVPASFTLLESFPHTPNGKLDRKALPEPLAATPLQPGGDIDYQSETESRLAGIWRELLGFDAVPRDVDFFELGGDSIRAAQMFIQIKERFGLDLTLAVLVQASTIDTLAKRIDSGGADDLAEFRALKRIQTGNESEAPMFWVHGGDGHVLIFRFFAENLGSDIPVYAFQWTGMDGGRGEASIMEMTEAYRDELLRFHPKDSGAIRLGGFCVGGLVAVELAKLLKREGYEIIDPLVIVGAPNHGAKCHIKSEPEESPQAFGHMLKRMEELKVVDAAEVPWEYIRPDFGGGLVGALKRSAPYALARRARTEKRLKRIDRETKSGRMIPPSGRQWYCGQTAVVAMIHHRNTCYDGDILYFRSGVCHGEAMGLWGWWDSPYMGFEELCEGHFEGVVIGGAHEEVLRRPEVARIVREKFNG